MFLPLFLHSQLGVLFKPVNLELKLYQVCLHVAHKVV